MTLTALEEERIKHVNLITGALHDSCDEIYESLIDRDYSACKTQAKSLILQLKNIIDSIEDDI
jgi:hypothetical protein|tara:strand:- start:475 stop:663 length:189 start_codon:yes stop_codon:yes gene_type:complete